MKILGLILELNPFHNGHKYFIEKAIETIKPDLVIAIISTSFTMRGDISVLDKSEKTKLCLENNIDIVLELPFIYTVNSSDYYAYHAIKILNEFNITDLMFGSENGNIQILEELNTITSSSLFEETLKSFLDKGLSYPSSSLKALMAITDNKDLIDAYPLPNNTLAMAYLKQIKQINKNIIPHTIQRIDNQYFDKEVTIGKLASATSLREQINQNKDISSFIPNYEYDFVNSKDANQKLFELLKYNLIQNKINNILGISEGIENRLISFIENNTYEEYIKNVQTKRYPLNRIQRIILHIIMNSTKINDINYLRILGINSKGLKYLKNIKEKYIITNTKDTLDSNEDVKEILENELKVTRIYDLVTNKNTYKKEFILQVRKNDN